MAARGWVEAGACGVYVPSEVCVAKFGQSLSEGDVAYTNDAHHLPLRAPKAVNPRRYQKRRTADARWPAACLDPVALHPLHQSQRRHGHQVRLIAELELRCKTVNEEGWIDDGQRER